MRVRTVLAGLLLLGLLAGGVALLGGTTGEAGGLAVRWLSETGVPTTGNHHPVAAGRVDGGGLVAAPISGEHGSEQCRLAALDPADGSVRWTRPVTPERCFVHAVGTPAFADADGDGAAEVLVGTAERRLAILDPGDGAPEGAVELEAYGYSPPVVGPLLAGGAPGLGIVDARGTVVVADRRGAVAWTHEGGGYVWATPTVLDVDGDGGPELVVGFGDGTVTAFEPGGAVAWNRTLPAEGSLTWLSATPGERSDGPATVFAATGSGGVYAIEGTTGRVVWERDLGRLAAVGPVLDGDGDGALEVYATAADGRLRSLDVASGRPEWETRLTDETVQVAPPPVAGDVDGDGRAELVATTNDGGVQVVDPRDGSVLAGHARTRPLWAGGEPVPIWTTATVADADGDGVDEIYVTYGDGRVLALAYRGD